MPPEEESQLTDSTSQNNNMGDTETSVYPCYADGEEVDDEFFQDCTQSPQSLYYSSHVLSNHSPSPSALSFGETDIQPFGSGRMCQSTCAPHAKYIDRSDQDTIDPNTSTSSADNEPVALFRNDYSYMRTYPSGRPPLIPLDTDFVENTKKERKTKREAKTTSKKENPKETVSWISRSLCAVHTDSSFDSTEHGRDSDVDFSKDANICFPFDEEGSREYEEADDDCTEDINDYRCNSPLIDKTIMTNDDTRKESVEIEVKPEIFNSLDDFFRQNRMLCNTLESWYNEIEQKSDIIQLSPNCHKNHVSPHNSSNNLITRKRRVQRLRHNMAPFDVDQIELNQGVVNMKKYSPVESDRIKFSFSNTVSTAYRRKPEVKHTSLASSYNTAQVRECAPISITTGCGNFGDMPDIDIVPTEEEDGDSDNENINTCYDSDPTDLLPSLQTPKRRERYKSRRFKRHIHLNVNDIDEDTCLEKICEHMNAKRLLVWHRHPTEDASIPPTAIHAWVEHGSQLDSALIQPKFCWRKNFGTEKPNNSILKISRYHSIDLLDIAKIVAVDYYIDRSRYPFAKRSCSFVIEAFDQEAVFEARDERERDDIVEGLKLLVARLGSKIILGDGRVLDEFFSPMGASVPGGNPFLY